MADWRGNKVNTAVVVENRTEHRGDVTVKVEDGITSLLLNMKENFEFNIPRSVALAGARVISDRARKRTPVYSGPPKARYSAPGKISGWIKPSELRDSIYHAFDDPASTGGKQTYTVSWSSRKVGFGHLIEFGHVVKNRKNGKALGVAPAFKMIQGSEDALPMAFKAMSQRVLEKYAELYPQLSKQI